MSDDIIIECETCSAVEQIAEHEAEILRLRAENETLRAALKDIVADMNGTQFPQTNVRAISVGTLNAAAAALKETE